VLIKYHLGSEIKKNEMARHVARMRERRDACSILMGYLRERDHLEDSGVDGRILLKWFFKIGGGEGWIEFFCLRIGTGGGRFRMRE
jgi:hypothetical protein